MNALFIIPAFVGAFSFGWLLADAHQLLRWRATQRRILARFHD